MGDSVMKKRGRLFQVRHYTRASERREYIWGDARRSADKRIPVLNFPNIAHLPANDKNFSLRLK